MVCSQLVICESFICEIWKTLWLTSINWKTRQSFVNGYSYVYVWLLQGWWLASCNQWGSRKIVSHCQNPSLVWELLIRDSLISATLRTWYENMRLVLKVFATLLRLNTLFDSLCIAPCSEGIVICSYILEKKHNLDFLNEHCLKKCSQNPQIWKGWWSLKIQSWWYRICDIFKICISKNFIHIQ